MPSNDEIQATLCAPGQCFEIETVDISGVPTRAWKNAPRSLDAVLVQGAAAAGARDFLVLDDERISHERHLQLAERFATSVVDLGVRKGDRVAIAMRNLPEWSIAFFGAAMAGAIAVPINAFGTGEELAFAIADSDATVVVALHLATHKVPAHVWIAEEPLPRGDTGKVLKRVIQAEYAPLVPTS